MNGVIAETGCGRAALRSGDIIQGREGSAKSLASERASRNEVVKPKSLGGAGGE